MVGRLGVADGPETIYFKTSRRMASVASIRTREDIFETLEDSFSGSARDLLRNRLGIDPGREETEEIVVNTDDKVKRLVDNYEAEILRNAAEERESYLSYMRGLRLNDGSKIGLADIGIKGTIQYHLEKIIDADLTGCYLTGYSGNENPYGLGGRMKALYPARDPSNLLKYHILFESVFTAPEGMYVRVDPDGKFVHGPKFANQQLFSKKRSIYRGVERFVLDVLDLHGNLPKGPFDRTLIDELFGLAMSGDCCIQKRVTDAFFVDEMFGTISEKKIWD